MYLLSHQEIEKRVSSREVRIGLIGLGRVGLPLAATLANEGFEVTGIDIQEEVIAKVSIGESPFPDEVGLKELVERAVARKTLRATSQIAAIKEHDLIIITVSTFIRDEHPEIEAIQAVASELAQYLSPSKLHYPVKEYVAPDRFAYYTEEALKLGFLYVASAPYVRSSYLAAEYIGDSR